MFVTLSRPMSSLGRLLVFVFILLLSACATKDKATGGYGGHGLDSIDEKTLAEFAPPALSGEKLRRIQGLLDVRSPSAGALSPDNKYCLFISWNVTETQAFSDFAR
jgi:hypothetical protein